MVTLEAWKSDTLNMKHVVCIQGTLHELALVLVAVRATCLEGIWHDLLASFQS